MLKLGSHSKDDLDIAEMSNLWDLDYNTDDLQGNKKSNECAETSLVPSCLHSVTYFGQVMYLAFFWQYPTIEVMEIRKT